jgi:cytochrome P450
VVHRNAEQWPDPLAFRPERFMPGAPAISPKAYVPFGVGARRCIGMQFALMEISAAVSQLFRDYDVTPLAGEWRGLCSDFTLTPRAPLHVRVTPK